MRSWRNVVLESREDSRPWLIVPEEPCASARHRSVARRELARAACSIASALARAGVAPGDRVVVIADNSVETSTLLVAILAAGFVAVPITPRTMGISPERWRAKLRQLCASCEPRAIVGRAACLPLEDVAPAPCLTYDSLAQVDADERDLHGAPPDALALIQYTSGTTGHPRGVELTHGNLIHDIVAVAERIGIDASDVGLTWLPLFHDMGLIGSLLAATYAQIPLVLLTPSSFLLRPESWLWAIARFGVTCCAAPNSAYQLCCTKIPDRKLAGLDLSTWRVALNGAELVHPATVAAFSQRFAPFGFRSSAMFPVYGLAENTIATAFPEYGSQPAIDWIDRRALEERSLAVPTHAAEHAARGVVSVGRALHGQELRVVETSLRSPARERVVGAIQVRGACVMRGYHRDAEQTARVLDADGWLDTGDLGYMAAGELHVVGRSKELINRGGRKFSASELQQALGDVQGVRGGLVAAFGVPDAATGTERIVVMAETVLRGEGERAALRSAIAAVLSSTFALSADEIALVPQGTVPRTTSGKIQHNVARARYLSVTP